MLRLLSCLLLGLTLFAGPAAAQPYPDKSKPLRLLLPQGPGGASDIMARTLAKAITETSDIPVVIDNKPGAETVIGVQALLASPADGYTILLVSLGTPVFNVVMIPNLPYDPFKDFIPLAGISKTPSVVAISGSSPFKTLREFIAAAKAKPGKYTFASATTGTRLPGELLQATAGIKLVNVPYKTTPAAATALASGEVDLYFADGSVMAPFAQNGRVRIVATTGATRSPAFPQVPTVREEGVENYNFTAWFATYFARGTPPDRVATMRDILRRALKAPLMVDYFAKNGYEPLDVHGDDLTDLARRDVELWDKVVKNANLRPQ
jgi:tripartite-type tricarboxylate transporter receptor subunit TctC